MISISVWTIVVRGVDADPGIGHVCSHFTMKKVYEKLALEYLPLYWDDFEVDDLRPLHIICNEDGAQVAVSKFFEASVGELDYDIFYGSISLKEGDLV